MDSPPFALSIHHFISSVGADAGFASLIGLALLVLLYFAHARETATLRARADEAGLRVQELEGQLADLADQVAALPAEISVRAASPRATAAFGGVQQRVAAGAGAGVPAGVGGDRIIANGLPPAAPAGVAAPALAAATRLIPDPGPPVIQQPVPATMAGTANGASHAPAAASAAALQRVVGAPAGAPPRRGNGPSRVGGGQGGPGAGAGRPGGGQGRPAAEQRRPVGGYPGSGGGQSQPGGAQSRPGRPASPGMPLRQPPRRSRTGRVLAALLVAAVAIAAVVAGVILITNRNGSSTASRSSASASLASHRTGTARAVVPSTVTVSVLNGTGTSLLAGRIAAKLVADGYKKGAVTNASDSTHATSIVAYTSPGLRRDALAVATSLRLPPSSVHLVDSSTKSVACAAASLGCNSAVYVTVGSDLSGL